MEFSHYDYVPNNRGKSHRRHKAAHGEQLVEEEACRPARKLIVTVRETVIVRLSVTMVQRGMWQTTIQSYRRSCQ